MTTICYRDGMMAADSQVTGGDIRRGQAEKIFAMANGAVAGFTGDFGAGQLFCRWYEKTGGRIFDKRPELPQGYSFTALVVDPDGTVSVYNERFIRQVIKSSFYAIGSGNEVALGAMEMGASAERAVEVAGKYDVYTDCRIRVVSAAEGAPRG